MIKLLVWVIVIFLILYVGLCLLFFFYQERFLFYPEKLSSDARFFYPFEFEEHFIEVEEGIKLHGLLFKTAKSQNKNTDTPRSRRLVFYLHGNAGSLNNWGYAAEEFLLEGYDVFMLDYRGYGKSDGQIGSEKQLFSDVEKTFLEIKNLYQEKEIIITGFSIGSGPASWLASRNKIDLLVLIAPFYNMKELASHYFPYLPSFILRYSLKNNIYLQKVETPVVLIHGREDEIIPYKSSLKLKEELKTEVRLFILEGSGHNDISGSQSFRKVIREVFKEKELE